MNANTVSSRVIKVALSIATALIFLVGAPLISKADGIKKDKKQSLLKEEQVSVQYTGANDNNFIFRVEFENPTAEKFWLIIKNDAGDVVYHKQFSDVHFSKTVFFPKEEGDIQPTFVIRNGNEEIVRQFSVNRTLVENTTVTRL